MDKKQKDITKIIGTITAVGALLWAVIRIILFCGDLHRTVEETAATARELKAASQEHHDELVSLRTEMRLRFREATFVIPDYAERRVVSDP